MHHTDYSDNLRKTQHKTLKSLSTNQANDNRGTGAHLEQLRAAIAALLVVIALLQMDPANAEPASIDDGFHPIGASLPL